MLDPAYSISKLKKISFYSKGKFIYQRRSYKDRPNAVIISRTFYFPQNTAVKQEQK